MPLRRQVIQPGDLSRRPQKYDRLSVNYTGWTYEPQAAANDYKGTQFDSSLNRGRPIQFILGQGTTITGWEQALLQMSLGEKSTWTMTPDLAYGCAGLGRLIPPNTSLIFDIELKAIDSCGAPSTPQ